MSNLFNKPKPLIYDLEIAKAVPPRTGKRQTGVEYCKGWEDHKNMGISCLCCFDYANNRNRVFGWESKQEFIDLTQNRDPLVSFNGLLFDNKVIEATWGLGIPLDTCYDILREVWIAVGVDPDHFEFKSHGGYGLEALCKENFGIAKTGDGASAPAEWQRGRHCTVIDYCLNDVRLTRALWEKISRGEPIKAKGREITLRKP